MESAPMINSIKLAADLAARFFDLERVRFELNHDRALSFCFDAFSSNAFSSEVDTGSREENAVFYHLGANWNAKPVPTFAKFAPLNRYPLRSKTL
jgi:hypothetical protein